MNKLFSLLFPRKCSLCGMILSSDGEALCGDCRLKYDVITSDTCPECGRKETECRCGKVASADRQMHLFEFSGDTSKKLIYTLKRRNDRHLQEFFACEAEKVILHDGNLVTGTVITYVPRSPESTRDFGFDQAKCLAEKLAARLGVPCVEMFLHARRGKTQKSLSAREREENAAMVYTSKPGVPSYENVIIIDDVSTSGSTLSRCADLARGMGAKHITVFTVAVTGKKIID